jgi:hypothetical protein
MKFDPHQPPREFSVGRDNHIRLKDCGDMHLEPDEQITFQMGSGAEYDIVRKSWGVYATPSLNGRLERFGLRSVLVESLNNRFYVLLVERGKEPAFHQYLNAEQLTIVTWLDGTAALESLKQCLRAS